MCIEFRALIWSGIPLLLVGMWLLVRSNRSGSRIIAGSGTLAAILGGFLIWWSGKKVIDAPSCASVDGAVVAMFDSWAYVLGSGLIARLTVLGVEALIVCRPPTRGHGFVVLGRHLRPSSQSGFSTARYR